MEPSELMLSGRAILSADEPQSLQKTHDDRANKAGLILVYRNPGANHAGAKPGLSAIE